VAVPVGAAAEEALKEIAEMNLRVHRAHERYEEAAAEAKERRERWQGLAEQLQTLIATKTTAPSLPLFSAEEREADQERMEAGGTVVPLQPPAPAPPDGSPSTDPQTVYDDDLMF
jgi:hypothetical protein